MQPSALIFFIVFTLILVVSYLALRRHWVAPGKVAVFCVVGSIITMTLSLLNQPDVALAQGILFGLLIGGGFALVVLAAAWYFQRSEMRQQPPQS